MTTAAIGATGRVGSEVARGLLARGEAVAALVGDAGKARRAFGEPGRIPSIEQVTRLSVLNTSADSLGINQRAYFSMDQFASLDRGGVLDDPPRDLVGVAAAPPGSRRVRLSCSHARVGVAGENDYATATFQQITGRPHARSPGSVTSTARSSSDARASPRTSDRWVRPSDRRDQHLPARVVLGPAVH